MKPYMVRVSREAAPALGGCTPRHLTGGGIASTTPLPATLPAGVNTLFLVNQKRLGDTFVASEATAVMNKLATLASRSDLGVNGLVLAVEADPAVASAYSAWDARSVLAAARPADGDRHRRAARPADRHAGARGADPEHRHRRRRRHRPVRARPRRVGAGQRARLRAVARHREQPVGQLVRPRLHAHGRPLRRPRPEGLVRAPAVRPGSRARAAGGDACPDHEADRPVHRALRPHHADASARHGLRLPDRRGEHHQAELPHGRA